MRAKVPSPCLSTVLKTLRIRRANVHLILCFVLILLSTSVAMATSQNGFIWFANGILLAYLLLAPRARWPAYLSAAFFAHALGASLVHLPWQITLIGAFLSTAEGLLGAALMRRRSTQLPEFTKIPYLLRFLAFAVFLTPLANSTVGALFHVIMVHDSFLPSLIKWFLSDSVGICVVTPACVAIFRSRIHRGSYFRARRWYMLPFAIAVFLVFSQAKLSAPFVLFPVLILVMLNFGLGWASFCTLFVACVGSWFTVRGLGPFAALRSSTSFAPALIFQLWIASAMFMLYSISVVIENLRDTERKLKEIVALHKLVTENSRDVIALSDFDGSVRLLTAMPYLPGISHNASPPGNMKEIIHPDDWPQMETIVQELRGGKDGALVECRARRRDGIYIWVESSLRTIRDPHSGVPTGILNNVREITARKIAEQQLADAYRTLETLAVTDALTGLANRRRFDQCINTEWRRGLRDRKSLSLLLIDADLFKSYNDTYGHLRGDGCLKQIAEAAQDIVSRPGDLVARFGGEEFAVILPNTNTDGARQIAEAICIDMKNRRLPHSSNPVGVVTVSIGCATLVPQLGQGAATLIECADQALYQAKRSGRNQACLWTANLNPSFNPTQSETITESKTA